MFHVQPSNTCFDCTISCCAVHAWVLKQSRGILMSPVIKEETATLFIKLSYQYNQLGLSDIKKMRGTSLLFYF